MRQNDVQKSFDILTALRGILAIWVVFYHLKPHFFHLVEPWVNNVVNMGYVAVDFFFVLSGFVIAMTYQEKMADKFTYKNLASFYIKRIARIYPLHFCIMILYLILPFMFIVTGRDIPAIYDYYTYFTSLVLLNSWGIHDVLSWNIPSWSISTEFACYLLFPFIIFILNPLRSLGMLLIVTILSCSILGLIFYQNGSDNIGSNIPYLGIWRCIFEFTLGIILFGLYRQGYLTLFGELKLFLLMVSVLLLAKEGDLPNYFWLPFFMTLFIGFFICLEDNVSVKVPGILLWLGDISYSIYLGHYFIKDVMKLFLKTEQASWEWVLVYLSLVLISSHVAYKFYELPAKSKLLRIILPSIDKR